MGRKKKEPTLTYEEKKLCIEISNVVSEVTNVSIAELFLRDRRPGIVNARYLTAYFLRSYGLTLKQVAYFLSPVHPLDHSTLVHGQQQIMQALEDDKLIYPQSYELRTQVAQILTTISKRYYNDRSTITGRLLYARETGHLYTTYKDLPVNTGTTGSS